MAQPADTLLAPVPDMQFFGWSLATDGQRLVVGADENLEGARQGNPKGTAFVYRLADGGPQYEGRLESDQIGNQDCFGWQLGVREDVAIAAAECESPGGDEAGSVYVYRYDGAAWQREGKVVQGDVKGSVVPGAGDWSYLQAALGDGVLAVGASGRPEDAPDAEARGAVFLFEHTDGGWAWSQTLVGTDANGAPSERFGSSVAMTHLDGRDVLFVGAPAFGDAAPGQVYAFESGSSGWTESARIACEGIVAETCGWAIRSGGGRGVLAQKGFSAPSQLVTIEPDGEGWEFGSQVAPPELDLLDATRSGDVILAMGWRQGDAGNEFALYVLTDTGEEWRTESRTIPPGYYADAPLARAADMAYVGIGYGGSLGPGAVLMVPLGAVEVSEGPAPAAQTVPLAAAPNPTVGPARLSFATTRPGSARIVVTDALGRRVLSRDLGVLAPGAHEETVALQGVAAGVYLVRVETAEGTATVRLVRR